MEEELKNLFKEINQKPENLDHNIMSSIYLSLSTSRKEEVSNSFFWGSVYGLLGLLTICGLIYLLTNLFTNHNSHLWLTGFAMALPMVIRKIISYRLSRLS